MQHVLKCRNKMESYMIYHYPKIKFQLILLTCLLCAFFGKNLNAQSGTTSVSGTIFDQQGQIISGATITLSNTEKGFTRTATTNDNGTFSFRGIQPAIYRLEVEMNGFKKFVNAEVRAIVDTPTEISAVLEIGNINETVNVRSDTAESLLNTQDATIGNPFNSTQVTQLPTEARDVVNLLTLQPGVTRFGYVVGGRSDQANITLDGVDVNNSITNNIFDPVLRLNAEAIEEFRVTNDHLTPVLVARYDTNNFLGFSSSSEIPFYFYNLTGNPGPPFTGFNQNIRNLPHLTIPTGNLTFPIQPQNQTSPTAIEIGFDENRVSPINYSWNLTYERTLPKGFIVSVSYLGRKARNLLQSRDAAAVANFVDRLSGMDWNTAATQLEILRQQGVPVSQIGQIPYFANLFPADYPHVWGVTTVITKRKPSIH